ncbi:MAG TPA: NAD(P)/FAD-dependent oxidoreductase [Rhizomicrobium sp.]|nr:NAD(P)/FAD-dependent oxidoreductase [Rhizomicrobium sp.]
MIISSALANASDSELQAALAFADPLVLAALIYHATADTEVAQIKVGKIDGAIGEIPGLTEEQAMGVLRKKALDLLKSYRDGKSEPPDIHSRDRLAKAMSIAVGQPVDEQEVEFWTEELALDPLARRLRWSQKPDTEQLEQFHVIVIGAGMEGANAAIQLKQAGIPFTVFEKNAGVGGTWHQNRYPGARVDFPSRIYSHVFGIQHQFRSAFSPQKDTEKYLNWCFDHYEVRPNLRLNSEVTALSWNEDAGKWIARVKSKNGGEELHHANAIVMAVGLLDRPAVPQIPGIENFRGRIIHTTELTAQYDLTRAHVAVIGTGASGMQLVPDIAPSAKSITIFQRSAGWVTPIAGYRDELPSEALWLDANVPFYRNWSRFIQAWMIAGPHAFPIWGVDPEWQDEHTVSAANKKLRDRLIAYMESKIGHRPDLMEKCLPDYPPLAKRIIVDNGWFDALVRDNVTLISEGISKIEENTIVTPSGQKVPADIIVLATGFKANEFFWPMKIEGRDGISLEQVWARDGARAFWGVAIPHMPNFFSLYGPNANPRNGNPVMWGETQTRYALQWLEAMIANDWKAVEVRQDAFDAYNIHLDKRLAETIWMSPGQASYYQNEFGRSAVMAPWGSYEYWQALRHPRLNDFEIVRRNDAVTHPNNQKRSAG